MTSSFGEYSLCLVELRYIELKSQGKQKIVIGGLNKNPVDNY